MLLFLRVLCQIEKGGRSNVQVQRILCAGRERRGKQGRVVQRWSIFSNNSYRWSEFWRTGYFSYLQFRSIELRINNIELAPFTFPHWLSNYRISRDTRRYSKAIKLLFPSSFLSSRFLRLAFFFAAFSITYRQPLCRVRIKAAFIHFFSFSSINSVYCDKPRSKDLFV